ncbi:hypothetical protein SeMB42_g04141 [Synchytrium endobioticum]|uniref:Endonuclease V n=1 Tax=Synchytrium endobioticum TaxID=286115 RepID=A0A507D5B5_9FUNG|nr:hypothetical protein SeMB42_g04141 [Synchytrium endobioticum]TPX46759.1 hypothetical protein SeLEV6574_g03049 [Synchytrium endobioticum]TPX46764.1 hypothetical protein SeLEV6574_g03044 [Synchytrium endobioticum]
MATSATDADAHARWISIQDQMGQQRVNHDKLDFAKTVGANGQIQFTDLHFVGGLDVSCFAGNDCRDAIACVVVLKYPEMTLIYEDSERAILQEPYIPGFLAFREVPATFPILSRLKRLHPEWWPQVLFVDGNGTLHPRRFGFACHIGVLHDIPAIGIGKTFLAIRKDGLLIDQVKKQCRATLQQRCDVYKLAGSVSGFVYGAGVRTGNDAVNPVFVSPGHRISLETAIDLTLACCQYRVPEPIRMADHLSRKAVRNLSL